MRNKACSKFKTVVGQCSDYHRPYHGDTGPRSLRARTPDSGLSHRRSGALIVLHPNPVSHWNPCYVDQQGECLVCRLNQTQFSTRILVTQEQAGLHGSPSKPCFPLESLLCTLVGRMFGLPACQFPAPRVPQWEEWTGADLITGGSRGGPRVPRLPPPPPGLNPPLWGPGGWGGNPVLRQVKPNL